MFSEISLVEAESGFADCGVLLRGGPCAAVTRVRCLWTIVKDEMIWGIGLSLLPLTC